MGSSCGGVCRGVEAACSGRSGCCRSSGPEERVYDSNVLVVVEDELVEWLVIDAAIEAERQTGMHGVLSPITCTAKDPFASAFPSSFTVNLKP